MLVGSSGSSSSSSNNCSNRDFSLHELQMIQETNLQHMILLAPYWALQIITLVAVASCTSSNRLTFVEHSSKITEHQNYLIISIKKIITPKKQKHHQKGKKKPTFLLACVVGVLCLCAKGRLSKLYFISSWSLDREVYIYASAATAAAAAAAASSSFRFNKYMRALSRHELLCDLRALLEEALINWGTEMIVNSEFFFSFFLFCFFFFFGFVLENLLPGCPELPTSPILLKLIKKLVSDHSIWFFNFFCMIKIQYLYICIYISSDIILQLRPLEEVLILQASLVLQLKYCNSLAKRFLEIMLKRVEVWAAAGVQEQPELNSPLV